jgi:hypothetical protein
VNTEEISKCFIRMASNETGKRGRTDDDAENVISRSRKRRIAHQMADEELSEFVQERCVESVSCESEYTLAADHNEHGLPDSFTPLIPIPVENFRHLYFLCNLWITLTLRLVDSSSK